MQKNSAISSFLQNFIYLMNDENVRSTIITKFCKDCSRNLKYIGTFYVNGSKYNLIDTKQKQSFKKVLTSKLKKLKTKNEIHFTVSYSYNINSVHYVSFVYLPSTKKLIHFDPGISMYEQGQKTIVPSVFQLLKQENLLKTQEEIGECPKFNWGKKKTGVQFNNHPYQPCPRDAFCQTWTVFFIYQTSKCKTFRFVKKWCEIPPEKRETYLVQNFIAPILRYFPNYYQSVQKDLPKQNYLKMIQRNS